MAQAQHYGVRDFLMANMPIKSQASYVEYGFGQVEPNHLSAQRTSQVYAQLPAAPDIQILEQGQFVKYDYEKLDITELKECGLELEQIYATNDKMVMKNLNKLN
jgi:hypothetical protein